MLFFELLVLFIVVSFIVSLIQQVVSEEKIKRLLSKPNQAINYIFGKENEILEKLNSHERELLKIFKDNAKITTYHFKNHKSNYLIIIGETNKPNVIGLTVIFDKKPFKQIGKAALGSLIAFTAVSGGSLLLAVAGLGILGSYFKRTFTIKGPLGKDLTRMIEKHFGEPIEIKE